MSLSMIPTSLIDSIVATALSGPSDNCDALCGWPTDMFDDTNQIGDLLLQAIIPAIRMRFGTTESVAAGEETRQSEESEPQVYHSLSTPPLDGAQSPCCDWGIRDHGRLQRSLGIEHDLTLLLRPSHAPDPLPARLHRGSR